MLEAALTTVEWRTRVRCFVEWRGSGSFLSPDHRCTLSKKLYITAVMRRDDFLDTFRRSNQRLTEPARLVLDSGSAMILLGYTDRDTGEGDAIEDEL